MEIKASGSITRVIYASVTIDLYAEFPKLSPLRLDLDVVAIVVDVAPDGLNNIGDQ